MNIENSWAALRKGLRTYQWMLRLWRDPEHCRRCDEPLQPDRLVWLELNCRTGRYSPEGQVPEHESQGCFAFGTTCARLVLRNRGRM